MSQSRDLNQDPTQHPQADSGFNAKEEPVEYDEDGELGDADDKTGGLEGSVKRPRLRLSQACERCTARGERESIG
jgi:hypothetical protein